MSDNDILGKDEFLCPRRVEGGFNFPGPDFWDRGRGGLTKIIHDWLRDKFDQHYFGGTRWDGRYPKPRTCSYCGSAHPDDVVALLKKGWLPEEAIGKNYKIYINVPVGVRSPVPPVKLYLQHCSRQQIQALRSAEKP